MNQPEIFKRPSMIGLYIYWVSISRKEGPLGVVIVQANTKDEARGRAIRVADINPSNYDFQIIEVPEEYEQCYKDHGDKVLSEAELIKHGLMPKGKPHKRGLRKNHMNKK